MPANQPYDPSYNAKIYISKLTEEQRRARATPLENLRSLRFRSEGPAAPVEAPIPAVPQALAPQDTVAPQDVPVPPQVPAPDKSPSALEVVQAEFPDIFTQGGNRPVLEVHEDEQHVANASVRADGHAWEHARNEANIAEAPDPPSALAYEEDDILACANVVSFYSRLRRNLPPAKAARQRSGDPSCSMSLIPHHSSG